MMTQQNVANSATAQTPAPGEQGINNTEGDVQGGRQVVSTIWKTTFEDCKSQLTPKELEMVVQVRTYDQLIHAIEALKKKHEKKKTTKALQLIDPFLKNLSSFTKVIDTSINTNPDIASLCWGGIKLVLELSFRFKDAIDKIASGLSNIGQILPQMESYQACLPHTPQLDKASAKVYEEVVKFCFLTIKILRKHPVQNWFSSLWRNYNASLQEHVERIQLQSRNFELEANLAKWTLDKTRHEEIRKLLTIQRPATMAVTLPCYSIPFAKNAGLFGRENELQLCINSIDPVANSNSSKGVALHGCGGVGKTSIALELAYKEKSRRKVILWFAADDENKLSEGFMQAAADLGLHEENANKKADRDAVKTWLEKTTEPWLLVFDNVERPQDLHDYIPGGGVGAYVITSRNPDCSHGLNIDFDELRISSFSAREGGAFVLTQLPKRFHNDKKAREAAEALSEKLGGLVLALKQMGGFIRETGCGIDDLLTSLRDKEEEWALFADKESASSLGYPHNLSSAWAVSITALDSTAKILLLMFSLMDPDKIPEIITKSLRDACIGGMFSELFSSAPTKIRYMQSVRALVRYGLIEKFQGQNSYVIHRVVQSVSLQTASQEVRRRLLNAIIDLYLAKHPQSQATSDTLFAHWSTCALYAPHILHLHKAIKEWKLVPDSNEKLWILSFNCARYLLETGSMAKSLELIKNTESYCDVSTRDGQIQLSYLQNSRGLIALQHQEQEEARHWFTQAEAVRLQYLGDLDVNTVAVQGNLALTLINERRWQDLIDFNEPRARKEAAGILAHIPVRLRSSIYDLLSLAYLETGQLDKAWKAIETSTNLTADVIPVYSQLSGYIHFNRGNILTARGQIDEALSEQLRSFDIRKKVLGDHIQTAASCYRAAVLMSLIGKNDDALDLLKESKRMYGNLGLIGKFSKGGEARSAWRIGKLLEEQGRKDEANEFYQEAFTGLEALGRPVRDDLDEQDFNKLLNYVDS